MPQEIILYIPTTYVLSIKLLLMYVLLHVIHVILKISYKLAIRIVDLITPWETEQPSNEVYYKRGPG